MAKILFMAKSMEYNLLGAIDSRSDSNKSAVKSFLQDAKGKDVVFNISSEGGDYFEGLSIANLISSYEGQTTGRGMGIVASAATLVLLSCDEKMMTKNSFFMIHSAWSFVEGNAQDMQKSINLLNNIDEQMAKIYTAQLQSKDKLFGGDYDKTLAEIKKMMQAETWMTASEALELGFIDGLLDSEEVEDYKNYEAIFNKVRAQGKFKNFPNIKNENVMNDKKSLLQQLAAFFGFKAEIMPEETEVIEEPAMELEIEIEKKEFEDYTPEEKIEWYKKRIAELESGMSEMESKMKEMEATVESGKKKIEEETAVALSKMQTYKVTTPAKVANNKYTKEQIKASNDLIKSLFNK